MAQRFLFSVWCRVAAFLLIFSPGMLVSADLPEIQKRGKLIVAMCEEEFPPFSCTEQSGRIVGADVDRARHIADQLGVELELARQYETYDAVIAAVSAGKADVGIASLSITLARARQVYFTKPYYTLHVAMLINRKVAARAKVSLKNEAAALNRQDLKICARRGTSHVGFARELFPAAEFVLAPDADAGYRMVLGGEVAIWLSDDADVRYLMLQQPDLALRLHPLVLEDHEDPIGMAVHPDAPRLLHWLNLYIERNPEKRSLEALFTDYLEGSAHDKP